MLRREDATRAVNPCGACAEAAAGQAGQDVPRGPAHGAGGKGLAEGQATSNSVLCPEGKGTAKLP